MWNIWKYWKVERINKHLYSHHQELTNVKCFALFQICLLFLRNKAFTIPSKAGLILVLFFLPPIILKFVYYIVHLCFNTCSIYVYMKIKSSWDVRISLVYCRWKDDFCRLRDIIIRKECIMCLEWIYCVKWRKI
jgi:hypothetical protein